MNPDGLVALAVALEWPFLAPVLIGCRPGSSHWRSRFATGKQKWQLAAFSVQLMATIFAISGANCTQTEVCENLIVKFVARATG